MSTTTLGTWRKPPLAYVVAELVISPYYSLAEKMPELQDSLRNEYPRTAEGKELVIEVSTVPVTQSIWQLSSADKTRGVQFGTRVMSLHATSYVDSADFLRRWAAVLNAVQTTELGAFVERAGLRYIDIVVPDDNKSPSDYLAPAIQGITPAGAVNQGAMWAAAYQCDGCVVNLRTGGPSPRGVLLPPGFNALPLGKPSVMVAAERRLQEGGVIGFIDTDCLREIQEVFDAPKLVKEFGAMQKLASRTFQAALSDYAKGAWK